MVMDAPEPAPPAPSGDAWGDLTGDPENDSTPLAEQAAAFMPDSASGEGAAADSNGSDDQDDEGVGVRRGLFGR